MRLPITRFVLGPLAATAMLFLGASEIGQAAPSVPDITGHYRIGATNLVLAIADCGKGGLCGRIAEAGGLPANDARNPTPERQARGLCGLAVLTGLKWEYGFWLASLYDPQNGTDYSLTLAPRQDGSLMVEGHSGRMVFMRTYKRVEEVWARVPPPAPCNPLLPTT